ncbi:MAG: single-stranded DNA-binding protein [Chloroflexia bacterium]
MRGLNRVEIMGNLGGDPEMRYTPTGRPVTQFRVAVHRRWRNADGEPQEKVEWFRVVSWGRQAEIANQFLEKGAPVYVEGRLSTRSYEDASGQTRYITEVIARDLILLPRANGRPEQAEALEEVEEEEETTEIPF